MENTNNQQLISSLIAFRNIHTEIQGIEMEIKKLKMRLKPRLDELKKGYGELEKIIIEHLEKNNEPGIQYQDLLFLLNEKNPQATKKINKEDALITLLKKYNVQNPTIALEEVRKIFPIRATKTDSGTKKTIKLKKTV